MYTIMDILLRNKPRLSMPTVLGYFPSIKIVNHVNNNLPHNHRCYWHITSLATTCDGYDNSTTHTTE